MSQSFFLKCEKCALKPATIKLVKEDQEKKVCFQCERDIVKDSSKDWNRQFIPYSDLKKNNPQGNLDDSRLFSNSKLDQAVKSPGPASYSQRYGANANSVIQDKSDRFERSQDSHIRNSFVSADLSNNSSLFNTVSPKVRVGKTNYELTRPPQLEIETKTTTGVIRPNTPKKNKFYSDYLKDYDPKTIDFRSPTGRAMKKDIIEKTTRTYSGQSFLNQPGAVGSLAETQKVQNLRNTTYEDRSRHSKGYESSSRGFESGKRDNLAYRDSHNKDTITTNTIHTEVPNVHTEAAATLTTEPEKPRDLKKEAIRNRLSKLSEQLYSPVKPPTTENLKLYTNDEGAGYEPREQREPTREATRAHRKELSAPSNIEIHERTSHKERVEAPEIKLRSRVAVQTQDNIEDYKGKLTIDTYELAAANLRSHNEAIEKRNTDTVTKLREELRQTKDSLNKERTEVSAKSTKEVSSLTAKVNDLERRIQEDASRVKLAEDRAEQAKKQFEKKLNDAKEELERNKKEKDRRIEELNNQIKQQNKAQRDAIEKVQKENENFIAKLRTEYDFMIKDLNRQLEHKTSEVDRLKSEKEEQAKSHKIKVENLQESLRYQQEAVAKLRQINEPAGEEVVKLGERANGATRYNPRGGLQTPQKENS